MQTCSDFPYHMRSQCYLFRGAYLARWVSAKSSLFLGVNIGPHAPHPRLNLIRWSFSTETRNETVARHTDSSNPRLINDNDELTDHVPRSVLSAKWLPCRGTPDSCCTVFDRWDEKCDCGRACGVQNGESISADFTVVPPFHLPNTTPPHRWCNTGVGRLLCRQNKRAYQHECTRLDVGDRNGSRRDEVDTVMAKIGSHFFSFISHC